MDNLEKEARTFIKHYSALFSSPDACSAERVGALAAEIGKCYRPGLTMFTNGKVDRFEVC
jgi:hypothetical protein